MTGFSIDDRGPVTGRARAQARLGRARHVWTLWSEGAGTRAVGEESSSGPAPRLFRRRSRDTLDATLEQGMQALARQMLTGDLAAA